METTERNLREVEGGTPKEGEVNQVTCKNAQGRGDENGNCFHCGNSGHMVQPERVCHKCKNKDT